MEKRQFLKYCSGCVLGLLAASGNKLVFAGNKNVPETNQDIPLQLIKHSIEAKHYLAAQNNRVICQLCPHVCNLKPGERGLCRVRINSNGKLYSMVYGNPCAIHIDPVEKKPLFHFFPGSQTYSIATAGCNLSCLNCQNWEISQNGPENTRNYSLFPEALIQNCIQNQCSSISYTYTEPIVFYEYMLESAKIAKSKGIKNIMVTAGYINEKPLRELCPYIDAAHVDLKGFTDDTYLKLNGGMLQPILNTLKILKEEKVWLEIINLIVPTYTDDLNTIKKMCNWLQQNGFEDVPLHFSRFMPMHKLMHLAQTPVSILENARKIAQEAGLKYVYIGNVPGTEAESTYCPNCKKKIIDRRGYKIISNAIKQGKCSYCGEKIAGVWE